MSQTKETKQKQLTANNIHMKAFIHTTNEPNTQHLTEQEKEEYNQINFESPAINLDIKIPYTGFYLRFIKKRNEINKWQLDIIKNPRVPKKSETRTITKDITTENACMLIDKLISKLEQKIQTKTKTKFPRNIDRLSITISAILEETLINNKKYQNQNQTQKIKTKKTKLN